MRKFLRLLVISFLLLFVPMIGFADDYDYSEEEKQEIIEEVFDIEMYDELEKHTVSIFSLGNDTMSRCSGVVINEDSKNTYVLTAKHCIGVTEEVYVENNPVKLIIAPTDEDLALLIVNGKIKNKQPVTLATSKPELGDTIYHVAYPDFYIYTSKGTPIRETKDWTFANLEVISGCSGGGIFNENEELVGIVWGGFWFEPITIYEPLNDIKTFLEGVDY